MRSKTPMPARRLVADDPTPAPRREGLSERHRERVRADLQRRGVASDFSSSICDRLAPFSDDLTPELYDAVLSGVAMAYGVHRRGVEASQESTPDFAEVERLMSGFVSELRKLDEALETLAAYVSRLRSQAAPTDPVH